MKYFFFIYFLFLANEMKAQKQFYLGLKMGAGFTFLEHWINGKYEKRFDTEKLKYNFTGGLELNVALSKKLSLESDIIFLDKGGRSISDDKISPWKDKVTLGYIQFPELIRLNFNIRRHKRLSPFIEFGPYFSYYFFFKEVSSGPNISTFTFTSDIFNWYNKYDWGISGGGGLEKKMGLGKGNFELRYDNSIINVRQNPSVTYQLGNTIPPVFVTDKVKWLYSGLSLSMNFTYPLKRKKK